ncbi:MAG: hypothetical protein PHO41_01530 [Eubacteriales bacterium]|nr:hypothetical protein [Eubacteriales bacterium]
MRLPLFSLIDETIHILAKRKDFYQECAYELQGLFDELLDCNALIGVNVRVKGEYSLREKIIRKELYKQYDNAYELLSSLSDLIGLRAECRFLSEEAILYNKLVAACRERQSDGLYSLPNHPNIRLCLEEPQPEKQKNGLLIYRIDGRFHKNGVCTPFELQIKSMVHVFWAEVEHQLIYKNNSYQLVDQFMKQLLYSTYTNLEQVDHHLQLIYDRMQDSPTTDRLLNKDGMQSLIAKSISDVFFSKMKNQMGYSLRMNDACDILSRFLLERCSGDTVNDSFSALYQRIAAAAATPITFEEELTLGGVFVSEDRFMRRLGGHIVSRLNSDYGWNLFFRMLFALEPGNNMEDFTAFLDLYRRQFENERLYAQLADIWWPEQRDAFREELMELLAGLLAEEGSTEILSQANIEKVAAAIHNICVDIATSEDGKVDFERVEKSLRDVIFSN